MKYLSKILVVLIPCLMLAAGSATAAPPHGKGGPPGHVKKNKHKGYKDDYDRRHSDGSRGYVSRYGYSGGGPPPWAPAHGYRRKQEGHGHYAYSSRYLSLDTGHCNRELVGQILGGATGAVVGSEIGDGTGRLVAVAAGTVIGAVIGGEIGRSMDRADRLCIDQALEHAPDGKNIQWNDEGRQYTVTPRNTRQYDDGRYCREYYMETDIGGRTEQVYGRACRQPDGSWKLVS